ncbi:unnamed protein product [Rhodiola kirilowii]
MLSVALAARSSFDYESQAGVPFSILDVEFASWDFHDLISEPEPITSDPISYESNQTSPNSAETNQSSPVSAESNHGLLYSTEPACEPVGLDLDDRKLKRMKSNRESARRSRLRKQKRIENLKNEANQLNFRNRELSNRLRFVHQNGQMVRSENLMLRTEHSRLRHRLIELQNLLIFRGIHQMNNHNNNNFSSNYFGNGGFGETMMMNESTYLRGL